MKKHLFIAQTIVCLGLFCLVGFLFYRTNSFHSLWPLLLVIFCRPSFNEIVFDAKCPKCDHEFKQQHEETLLSIEIESS